MGLKLNATNGGGSVELDVPNTVNSDVVLTLPDADGDANQVLQTDGSGALSWVSKGVILNLEHSSDDTHQTSANTTWVSVYAGTTITSTKNSTTFLVHANTHLQSGSGGGRVGLRLIRTVGGTDTVIAESNEALVDYGNSAIQVQGCGFQVVDSPAQNSGTAITYSLEFRRTSSSGSVAVNNQGQTNIIVMELET